jgi:hypothetical protein
MPTINNTITFKTQCNHCRRHTTHNVVSENYVYAAVYSAVSKLIPNKNGDLFLDLKSVESELKKFKESNYYSAHVSQ